MTRTTKGTLLTAPGGGFATCTAAGHVRRALTAAGFQMQLALHGTKIQMTRGKMP